MTFLNSLKLFFDPIVNCVVNILMLLEIKYLNSITERITQNNSNLTKSNNYEFTSKQSDILRFSI